MSNENKLTTTSVFDMSTTTSRWKAAQLVASTAMVPKNYQNRPAEIIVAWQYGCEIGLTPLQSLASVAVVNGRATLWGDAMLALVMQRPDFEDIQETGDKTAATCVVKRRGRSPVTNTFDIDDAKAAGLWGKSGPWKQYPKRMLKLRARGFALRDSFPDALAGFKTMEEVRDYSENNLNPSPIVAEAPTVVDNMNEPRDGENVSEALADAVGAMQSTDTLEALANAASAAIENGGLSELERIEANTFYREHKLRILQNNGDIK